AYTFLVACMTLILGVTDLGLVHCPLPIVGQRNRDVPWIVGACQQVFRKRWLLLALGLAVVGPYWFYTSNQHGWWGGGYLLASVLVLAVVLFTLREHYASTVMLIMSRITELNRVGFSSQIVRLSFVGVVLLLPMTSWSIAGLLAAAAAAGFVSVMLYKRQFRLLAIPDLKLDAEDARRVDAQIIQIAKPLVLPAIFYQVQGVITVFLVSFFGTSSMMAEVGAFGRLSMVLLVMDRVTNILLFPAIARAPKGPRLRKIVVHAHLAYIVTMMLVMLSS
ncbi:MAG: hypothetical protein ABUU24_02595, partial [Variovorax sp.]